MCVCVCEFVHAVFEVQLALVIGIDPSATDLPFAF